MENFLKLPLYQRFLIIFFIMLLIVGVDYYFYISDYNTKITAQLIKKRKIDKEYSSLMKYQDKKTLQKFKEEFEREKKKIEENKKMLPSEEEIPEFVKSIYNDAKVSGLEVIKIEKKDAEEEDYYKKIPIFLKVRGNFYQLLKFFKTITGPKKRIVNIKNIEVHKLPLNIEQIQKELGESTLEHWEKKLVKRKYIKGKVSIAEQRLINYRNWQEANKLGLFNAEFTVYTFSYTGKPMSAEARKKKKRLKYRKRKKRRR